MTNEELVIDDYIKKKLEEVHKDFDIISHLGHGGFAEVFHGKSKKDSKEYAIKILNRIAKDCYPEVLSQEYERLNLVKGHKNSLEHCHLRDDVLFMEHVRGPTIFKMLTCKYEFSDKEILRVRDEISSILTYGHQRDVIHRDVKPENIILGLKNVLIDYSLTDEMEKRTKFGSIIGTEGYIAPEIYNRRIGHSKESDLFGLGVVLLEMAINKLLPTYGFFEPDQGHYYNKINNLNRDDYLKKSIKHLLSNNPRKRIKGLE